MSVTQGLFPTLSRQICDEWFVAVSCSDKKCGWVKRGKVSLGDVGLLGVCPVVSNKHLSLEVPDCQRLEWERLQQGAALYLPFGCYL